MIQLLEKIVRSFDYQNELERYIISQKPTDSADVERLIKEYNYGQLKLWM